MIPYKKPFKGKVYVLIGGRIFSDGSTFALSAKNTHNITLFGGETGGRYYFHTGQYSTFYQLPNSNIMLRKSFVKITYFVTNNAAPKGSGILPDIEAKLTIQDLVRGKDSQLDDVIKNIQSL